jgi:hypothetical protein
VDRWLAIMAPSVNGVYDAFPPASVRRLGSRARLLGQQDRDHGRANRGTRCPRDRVRRRRDRKLRESGVAVLLISHNFDQVMRLSDHLWVMRAGVTVAGGRTAETTDNELVALITGTRAAWPRSPHLLIGQGNDHDCQPYWNSRSSLRGGTTPEEVSTIVTETKRAGFDLLEMSLHDPAQLDVPAARAALEQAGINIAVEGNYLLVDGEP